MERSLVTRKRTIKKKLPLKKLSNIVHEENNSPLDEASRDIIIQNDLATPNSPRNKLGVKNLEFNATLSPRIMPSLPNAPFGPKMKTSLMPCKDLCDSLKILELDALENYNI